MVLTPAKAQIEDLLPTWPGLVQREPRDQSEGGQTLFAVGMEQKVNYLSSNLHASEAVRPHDLPHSGH